MATENTTYPILTATTWWKLRRKFNSSIPKEVSSSYLASALEMTESSAKTNVIPKLKLIGFIDDDNKPTNLSIRWRDDIEYANVCKELINKLYPTELPDAIDDPLNNKNKVVKWFQNKTRVGEKAGQMMSAFYLLLVEADLSKQNGIATKSEKPIKKTSSNVQREDKSKDSTPVVNKSRIEEELPKPETNSKAGFKPMIHLDIQIHISPESSSEQIDKIFESMAKHLTGFKA